MPLWGGDVAKKVNYLEQGGSVWVFKLAGGTTTAGGASTDAVAAPAK